MKRYQIIHIFILAFVLASCAFAAPKVEEKKTEEKKTEVKKEEKAPEPVAAPIKISAQPVALATVDPKTLKVTYSKGADPRLVVDQLVQAWASATNQLAACQQELATKKDQK